MKLNLDVTNFLQQYWQKQPKVFRNAFPAFEDPLDEHDLAGLAELEQVDSRIVSLTDKQWQVYHGPFEQFDDACRGEWSLLVQGVDHYIDEANALLRHFNFIPNWRLDDLMVSFSVKNGGVGPHLDQYDVFIIQGKGSRRWQVGERESPNTPYPSHRPHPDLAQIGNFPPIIDEELQPGDMIYIPPGFPHNGVALENCLNYSIGFRAPNQMQLWENLLQHCHDNNMTTQRYQDPTLQPRQHSAEISSNELVSLQTLMQTLINDLPRNPGLIDWFLIYNTLGGNELPNESIEDLISQEEVAEIWHHTLPQSLTVNKCPGTRTLFHLDQHYLRFAVNGYLGKVAVNQDNANVVQAICCWLSEASTPTTTLLAMINDESLQQFVAFCLVEQWYEC